MKENLTSEIIVDAFIKFLKVHRAYTEFSRELHHSTHKGTLGGGRLQTTPTMLGVESFIWDTSNKGGRYWTELSTKWIDFCREVLDIAYYDDFTEIMISRELLLSKLKKVEDV